MPFLSETFAILLALYHEGAPAAAVFHRMVGTYGEISDELGCRPAYEQILASLRADGITLL